MTFDLTTEDWRWETSNRMALMRNCCSTGMRELKNRRGWDQTSAKVEDTARTRFPVTVRPGVVKKPLPVVWLASLGLPPLRVFGEYAATLIGM